MSMPIRSIAAPRYTVDEIESWPDDGNRYELLDGVLLVTPSPNPTHQLVATEIARILSEFLDPWPQLRVAAPGAIIVRPKTELQPDVLVFRRPAPQFKWEDLRHHLLAVEVMSRSTRVFDRDYKRPAYLALGVEEVWRVDSDEKVVYVSRVGTAPDLPCRDVLRWSPSRSDATLALRLARIFRGIDE